MIVVTNAYTSIIVSTFISRGQAEADARIFFEYFNVVSQLKYTVVIALKVRVRVIALTAKFGRRFARDEDRDRQRRYLLI